MMSWKTNKSTGKKFKTRKKSGSGKKGTTSASGKNIPALTMSGGSRPKHSSDILEYRVWVKPFKGGDDFYYRSESYKEILRLQKKAKKEGFVEKPLGVIRDKKSEEGYREVVLK